MADRGRNLKTIKLRVRGENKDVGFKRPGSQGQVDGLWLRVRETPTDLQKAEPQTREPQTREVFMRPDKPTFNTESGTKFHVCIFAVGFFCIF